MSRKRPPLHYIQRNGATFCGIKAVRNSYGRITNYVYAQSYDEITCARCLRVIGRQRRPVARGRLPRIP